MRRKRRRQKLHNLLLNEAIKEKNDCLTYTKTAIFELGNHLNESNQFFFGKSFLLKFGEKQSQKAVRKETRSFTSHENLS